MFYQTFLSPQVKRCAIITYKHDIYKLLNDLRLSLVSMSHPSAQSPRQIENFANASKKPLKTRNHPPHPPTARQPTRIPQPAPNTPRPAAATAIPRSKDPIEASL